MKLKINIGNVILIVMLIAIRMVILGILIIRIYVLVIVIASRVVLI